MLRAMEADYRACIESEARLAAAPSSVVGFTAVVVLLVVYQQKEAPPRHLMSAKQATDT